MFRQQRPQGGSRGVPSPNAARLTTPETVSRRQEREHVSRDYERRRQFNQPQKELESSSRLKTKTSCKRHAENECRCNGYNPLGSFGVYHGMWYNKDQ